MYQVKKRDGKVAEFNLVKISEAIRKAFEAQDKANRLDAVRITHYVRQTKSPYDTVINSYKSYK